MAVNIAPVSRHRAILGESPVWDDRAQCVWWVDITGGLILCFDPATGDEAVFDWGEPVGCLALRDTGGLVLATASGFWSFDPETGHRRHIADPEADLPGNRFNDGTTDRQGRFWAGSMNAAGDPAASLYRLDPDLTVTRWRQGLRTANGLAFSPDGRRMYLSDSHPEVRRIWCSDYETATGQPGEPEPFFDTRAVAGRPDGGTVDAEGCYWQAGVSGWELYRLSPKGEVLTVVAMPVEKPSRPVFGEVGLDTLFVTSISVPGDAAQPLAGHLFRITGLGVAGLADTRFAG